MTSSVSRLFAWAKPSYWPWTDRLGRFSALKTMVFAALFVPGIWIIVQYAEGWLGPRVLNEMIHQTGDWTVRFIILSLAVTPLRHAGQWPKLISVRRMVGLAALFYGLWHFSLYTIDQQLDPIRVGREIILRIYLTIGFAALLGLIALGVTSTDGMIRRMGALAWGRLHKIVHLIAALAVLHYFMQTKLDEFQPTLMLGLLVYLEGCRIIVWRRIKLGFIALSGLAVISGLLTALLEAGWYAVATRVHAILVLEANFHIKMGIRPAWWILIAGLVFAVIGGVRHWMKAKERSQPAEQLREARA